ncbi:MAG: hypothetical protein Q8L92_11715, partial [Rubrivivax sp.]|nr:hypothetical protein [Rubrivivax sp.]
MSAHRIAAGVRRLLVGLVTCQAAWVWAAEPTPAASPVDASQRLRIVGGLGSLSQYTRHEAPFWTRDLPRLIGGRAGA